MAMPVWSDQPFWRTTNAEAEVAAADYPLLRLFDTVATRDIAPDAPRNDLRPGAEWHPCSPETVRTFSACGYFFGREYQISVGVPVGLIAANWGGTEIAAWISADKMARAGWKPFRQPKPGSAEYQVHLDGWTGYIQGFSELLEWRRKFEEICRCSLAVADIDFDDSGWTPVLDGRPAVPQCGRYAHRLKFDLPPEWAKKELQLHLGKIDDTDITFFNGKQIGATGLETAEYWEAPRKYTVPAGCSRPGRNVVTIIHDNHYNVGECDFGTITLEVSGAGSLTIAPIVCSTLLQALPADFPLRPPVLGARLAARSELGPNAPNTLYNANVAPWTRYPIRGVIWYQGCNNNGELSYYQLHKMLIEDWREKWGQPEMPFLIVQLASFEQHTPEKRLPDDYFDNRPPEEYPPYAITREIQARMAEEYRNVAVIVAFDCGDHSDIHPRDKQTVGYRLARKARQMLFQESDIADGPVFQGIRLEQNKVRVFFKHTGSGLATVDGQAPKGFILGDRTGKLVWADAKIEGNTVVVSHPSMPEPQRVRYAFTGYCQVNLCNREGFPAMPFRSDGIDDARMMAF